MSKVIYLYNQDNLSSNYKLYEIILNFFKSISTALIINFFNYYFNDSISTNDSIDINTKSFNKNKISYIPLDNTLPAINFRISNKYIYSIQILNTSQSNFSFYLAKYNENKNTNTNFLVNLPEAKIIEFENNFFTPDKINYTLSIYSHTLSYQIPVIKFSNYSLEFLHDNNLYILLPFTIFSIYNRVITFSKIGTNLENLRKDILKLSENTYKSINNLNMLDNTLQRKDYLTIKDTISELKNYYLDSLYH